MRQLPGKTGRCGWSEAIARWSSGETGEQAENFLIFPGEDGSSDRGGVIALATTSLTAALTSAVVGDDAFFEYGYVWLPYAVAALVLLSLGAIAAARWRHSAPGTAELLLTSGALLAVLAAIVLGLADGAAEGNGLASIDPPVWQWMIDHRAPTLTPVAVFVTNIGSTVSMSVIAGCAVIYLLIKRRRGDAVLVAVVAAGAGLLVRFGKSTVGRERPPADFRLVTETNESFPSGHALASAAILGVVLVVFLPLVKNTGTRITIGVCVGLFVLAIGLSRLYLGVHWATDVLGGWVTGLAWLALCLTVRQLWRLSRGRPSSLVGREASVPGGGQSVADGGGMPLGNGESTSGSGHAVSAGRFGGGQDGGGRGLDGGRGPAPASLPAARPDAVASPRDHPPAKAPGAEPPSAGS